MTRLVVVCEARHTYISDVSTPGRARARGGVGVARLRRGERGRAGRAVVVADVRLEGSDRTLAAQVCGGGVGLEAGRAEAVREGGRGVDEVGADLVRRTRRAGRALGAVEVRVADAALDTLVALRLRRREEERRRRRAWLTVSCLVQAAAHARARRVVVVPEGRIRGLVAHRARLAVGRRVPR